MKNEKQYTKDLIREALICCGSGSCIGCPLDDKGLQACHDLMKAAAERMAQLEAEIEQLKREACGT